MAFKQMARLEPLTGLRGVAACSVLLGHGIETAFGNGGIVPFAARLSYFGISLFFVLSGFVIEYNYAESIGVGPRGAAIWRFFVARFARLYPLYAVSILCGLASIPHPFFDRWVTAAYLTLTQSWFNMEMAAFPPDWSISTEWFFYFAFVPLTLALAGLRRPVPALIVLCVAATVGLIALFHFGMQPLERAYNRWLAHGDQVSASAVGYFIYFCPAVRLLEFVAGMLVAKAYRLGQSGGPAPISAGLVMGLALAWCAAVVVVNAITSGPLLNSILSNFIFAPALAFFMLDLCRYESVLSRLLASRPAVFLGEISYSIYVWSFAAITLMTPYYRLAQPSLLSYANSALKLAVIVGVTIVFAYGSYALIEVPARRWIRQTLGG